MGDSRYHKWLVFLSSYMIMMAYVGFFYSQGAVFVIIMNRFNSSRLQTSIIQFLRTGSTMGSGLFVGIIIHKVGVMRTCMVGALLTSVSMLLSAFATSDTQLIFSMRIFLGFGISPVYIGCSTTAGHFEGHKFNTLVLSIVSTGSSVGGAIYPFLIQYLNDHYGMPGVCLVISAILLNGVAFALLWKSPNTNKPLQPPTNSLEEWADKKFNNEVVFMNLSSKESSLDVEMKNIDGGKTQGHPDLDRDKVGENDNKAFAYDLDTCTSNDVSSQNMQRTENANSKNSGFTTFTFKRNVNLMQHRGQSKEKKPKQTILESLKCLARQGCFWAYVSGLACMHAGTNQIPIFIVDLFLDKNFSQTSGSLSLLLFSVFSAIGRLSVGFTLRFPKLSPLFGLIIAPVVGKIGICGIWFSRAVEGSLAFMCIFGVCQGVGVGAVSVTTNHLFGVEHMSNTIGLFFTIASIGIISTGILNGYIRDVTSSYEIPVFISVGLCSSSCLLFIASHVLMKRSPLRKMEPKTLQITKF